MVLDLQTYRKIPKKKSPRAYIFQRPFLRGLFLEGLIFGGAYVRWEICVLKSIGLLLVVGRKFTIAALFYFVFERKFHVQAPQGGLYSEGRFNGGFFAYIIWRGLYMEGLIFGILR